ncbi:MAG: glycosyltransferase family 1 protein [Pseudomonadota bacterium]
MDHARMHIAIVSETYPPEINGVALTVRGMVNSLRAAHQVTVIRPRQGSADQPATDASMVEHLMPSLPLPRYEGLRFGLPALRRVARVFDQHQPQACYIATEGPLGWSALRACRQRGIPVLTGFHTRFDQYAGHYGVGMAERSVAAYLKRFHNRAHGTLIPTRELQRDLQQKGYQNVMLLPRAVDTKLFSPAKRCVELRRRWGVPDNGLAVIYVGRLAAEKNLSVAVEAFEAIKARNPRARFILVGDGPARAALEQQNPDYQFCGLQLGEALAAHYASADMFLFPSITETFGNVVLEALASAVPVVAYDYAAAAEHLRNGENGYAAPFDNRDAFISSAIVLSGLAGELPDLRSGARQSVIQLEPHSVAEGLVELFHGLAREKAA